jgi:hypothetical protein
MFESSAHVDLDVGREGTQQTSLALIVPEFPSGDLSGYSQADTSSTAESNPSENFLIAASDPPAHLSPMATTPAASSLDLPVLAKSENPSR